MRQLILFTLLLCPATALAADCTSVNGTIDGGAVTAERTVVLQGNAMQLGGTIDGTKMPHQTLPCLPFAGGVMCERRSGTAIITVTTSGKEMTETINESRTGTPRVKITYACTQAFTLKR